MSRKHNRFKSKGSAAPASKPAANPKPIENRKATQIVVKRRAFTSPTPTLEEVTQPVEKHLFEMLTNLFRNNAYTSEDEYVLVEGQAPVMLVAHLDTVHRSPVEIICKTGDGNILMSPQGIGGDDRCGVYALLTVYAQSPVKPWLLFTCKEETGGKGADGFCKDYRSGFLPSSLSSLKMLVEIDRRGKDDAVFYNCDNEEFEAYIKSKGFRTQYGSFTDISLIAPELGVAAVNLSSGYYEAHTQHEYINRKHLNETIRKTLEIVADAALPETPVYEYVEAAHYGSYYGSYGSYGNSWSCGDSHYTWDSKSGTWVKENSNVAHAADDDEDEDIDFQLPDDIREEYLALMNFFSTVELERYRSMYGDDYILILFEECFGSWDEYEKEYM